MSKTMKIVFLDVDGVLNDCFTIGEAWAKVNSGELELDKHEFPPGDSMMDVTMVDRLQRIVEATDAKIVISSTWREYHSNKQMTEFLKLNGYPDAPIIGDTDTNYGSRGDRIQRAIEKLKPDITGYVILEDNIDWLLDKQLPHTVATEYYKTSKDKDAGARGGLQESDVEKAIRILNKPMDT